MRSISALVLSVLLCGCDRPADRPPEPGAASEPAAAPAAPFFVGRWAARPDLCGQGAWVITAQDLNTAGEVSCRFEDLARTGSGYEAAAICWAEGPPQEYRIRFGRGPSAQALHISGGPFADMDLVRCPASGGAGA